MKNKITQLFSIKYPLIQAGMVWCSGWRLASAVSNNGGLGIIGSGSMRPDVLREHIQKCRSNTQFNFAVNLPLLFPYAAEHIDVIIQEKVPIVFTSAGNPEIWTQKLKNHNIIVVHVVSNLKFALKAINAGVDALVCEGFEAGGHNGKEETTSFCLIPLIKKNVDIPLIAAGGISSGKSMLAAMILGADGVQVGSRFVMSQESSAHINFKNKILSLKAGDTILTLKEITPVRMIKNDFYFELKNAYLKNASVEELSNILGKGRAKKGMFLGDLVNGELEIGQISCLLDSIQPASEIIEEIITEFNLAKIKVSQL
ncbi:MAG: nitronate monooxygenase [Flavobacteriales bacterium]|nr:nitronate monooxygenase [Flavobacteriales bacterium]